MIEPPIDFHRLEIFCKVIELKSFTKAADAVYLSQPTVSEHIRSLEEMLNERLIDRLGREVLPTQAGQILYKYARKILRLRQEAIQVLNQFSGTLTGQLLVGASSIPGTYILPKTIGDFKELHPMVQVVLKISNSRLIAKEVMSGAIEFGVVGAKWNDPSLEWLEMFSDELVLSVSPDHPWAQRDEILINELAREPFILREHFSGTRKVMMEIFDTHGLHMSDFNVVAEMGSTEAVRQSIKARIGVSILSRHAVDCDVDCGSLVVVPIKGIEMVRPFYLVQRKKRKLSPICNVFIEHIHSEE